MWRQALGAALLAVSTVWAGPFERVAAGDAVYADLATVRGSGLFDGALVRYEPGSELTRVELAVLWKTAYDRLAKQAKAATAAVAEPDGEVQQVAAAMQRLLRALRPELQRMDVDADEAQHLLTGLPHRVLGLRGRTTRLSSPADVLADYADDAPATVASDRWRAAAGVATVGPVEAGFGLGGIRFFERGSDGQRRFVKGHVLNADLRLRMGDDSVLFEYARSLGDRVGAQYGAEAARAFRASYEHRFGDSLTVDVGFRRLSRSYAALDGFASRGVADLMGIEAGLDWRGERLGVSSRGTLLVPEGVGGGWTNRFGATMDWQVNDRWRLSLGYQSDLRRRLANLEDSWMQSLSWGVAYGRDLRLKAQLNYRFDSSGESRGPAGVGEHTIGASLGLGF